MSGLEKKFATKSKIVNYIINRESTSKVEISKELNLSMPTVLSNVKDLLEKGIIIETGEYESTGGRKAKSIGINPSYRYAMGIVITANHLGMVLVNLKYEIVKSERIRLKFVSDMSYCSQVADYATKFLDHMNDAEQKEKLLGVGISIPGIINQEQKLVIKSHALKLENYSLSFLEQAFSVPVYFSNDANAAMMAEDMNIYQNAIYLFVESDSWRCILHRGKFVFRRKSEGRRIWTYDTCTSGPQVLLWKIWLCRCLLRCRRTCW